MERIIHTTGIICLCKFQSNDPWINADSALIYNPFKNKIVIQPITIFKWRYPHNFKSIFDSNFFITCRVLLKNGSKDRLSCIRTVPCLISCLCPEVQFRTQHNYCPHSFYVWKIKIKFLWNLLIETLNLSEILIKTFDSKGNLINTKIIFLSGSRRKFHFRLPA